MVRKHQSILPGAIVGNGVQLSVVANMLFTQRMHRSRVGEYCSALALYHYALEGNDVETYFVVVPGVGGAGYATWTWNNITTHEVALVVFDDVTDPEMGQKLMDELVRLFGDKIPKRDLKIEEPTTTLLKRAREKASARARARRGNK